MDGMVLFFIFTSIFSASLFWVRGRSGGFREDASLTSFVKKSVCKSLLNNFLLLFNQLLRVLKKWCATHASVTSVGYVLG